VEAVGRINKIFFAVSCLYPVFCKSKVNRLDSWEVQDGGQRANGKKFCSGCGAPLPILRTLWIGAEEFLPAKESFH
jgi:hypothetical protein